MEHFEQERVNLDPVGRNERSPRNSDRTRASSARYCGATRCSGGRCRGWIPEETQNRRSRFMNISRRQVNGWIDELAIVPRSWMLDKRARDHESVLAGRVCFSGDRLHDFNNFAKNELGLCWGVTSRVGMAVLSMIKKRFRPVLSTFAWTGCRVSNMKSCTYARSVYAAAILLAALVHGQLKPASVRQQGVVSKVDAAANELILKTDAGEITINLQAEG